MHSRFLRARSWQTRTKLLDFSLLLLRCVRSRALFFALNEMSLANRGLRHVNNFGIDYRDHLAANNWPAAQNRSSINFARLKRYFGKKVRDPFKNPEGNVRPGKLINSLGNE